MNNRTSRLSFAVALMASAAVVPTATPAGAQEPQANERMAELQQRLDEVREPLMLDDEQIEQLLPVLRENFDSTRAVLERHGINLQNLVESGSNRRRLNLRQLRALGGDLDEVREAMFTKIEELGFLSDEQFAEFKEIQEEQRAALRERLRARRGRV